jgi:hypothetical protein
MGWGEAAGKNLWGHAEEAEAGLKFGDGLVLVCQHVSGLAPQLQQCSREARNLPDALSCHCQIDHLKWLLGWLVGWLVFLG